MKMEHRKQLTEAVVAYANFVASGLSFADHQELMHECALAFNSEFWETETKAELLPEMA